MINKKIFVSIVTMFSLLVMILFTIVYIVQKTTNEIVEVQVEKYVDIDTMLPITTEKEVKLLPIKGKIYHGAFAEFGPTEDVVTSEKVVEFTELIEKEIVWGYFSNNWFEGIKYPEQQIQELHKEGVIPFIRLMPRSLFQEGGQDPIYTLESIINGEFDQDLRTWAQSARDSNIPMLVEFGTEVNGDWFTWSGASNGGGETHGYGVPSLSDGPERFRDAYRHIIDLFKDEGAYNITWFLHVNLLSKPNEDWNSPGQYYPGDEYIDWIGVSVYGSQREKDPWVSFTDLMDMYFDEVTDISPNKPIAILEFGVVEREGKDKSEWIREALQSIIDDRYQNIFAISYWHSNWTNTDGFVSDMRIDSSPSSLLVYKEMISNPIFVTDADFSH